MPAVSAPIALAQPREEEFELLISELTSEFRRLRQRISVLARENADLRSHTSSTAKTEPVPSGLHQDDSIEYSEECQSCGSKEGILPMPVCLCDDAAERAQLEAFKQLEEIEDAPKKSTDSNWKKSTTAMREPSTVRQESTLKHEITQKSGTEVRSAIHNTIHTTMNHSRMFEQLDVNRRGTLLVADLVKIMEGAHEVVVYDSLVKLVRNLNGLQRPSTCGADSCTNGTHEEASTLGLDFHAFQQLMDEEEPIIDEVDSSQESCIVALRRACRQQGQKPARKSQVQRGSYGSALTVQRKTCFERHAPTFLESVPPIVIMLNSLMAGLSVDYPQHESVWDIVEYVFVVLYSAEFLAKLKLYGCRGYWKGPDRWWNIFDFVCLATSLADTAFKIAVAILVPGGEVDSGGALFMMIKILRLSRLARLVRTLRFQIFQELKMMVLGVVSGLRVLTWAIILLCALIYLVAVAMTNLLGAAEPEFKDMRSSMFTLFRCWTEGCAAYDGTPLSERLRKDYGFIWMMFHILMTMFVTVGLFNLIMAIFIDNVVTSQLLRKHIDMVERSSEIMRKFKHLFANYIKDGTNGGDTRLTKKRSSGAWTALMSLSNKDQGKVDWKTVEKEWEILRKMNVVITKEVFMEWLEHDDFQSLLDDAEIDVASRSELFDVLDSDMGGELSMDELTTGLMKLRGAVTKSDIVAIRLKVRYLTSILESRMGVSQA